MLTEAYRHQQLLTTVELFIFTSLLKSRGWVGGFKWVWTCIHVAPCIIINCSAIMWSKSIKCQPLYSWNLQSFLFSWGGFFKYRTFFLKSYDCCYECCCWQKARWCHLLSNPKAKKTKSAKNRKYQCFYFGDRGVKLFLNKALNVLTSSFFIYASFKRLLCLPQYEAEDLLILPVLALEETSFILL